MRNYIVAAYFLLFTNLSFSQVMDADCSLLEELDCIKCCQNRFYREDISNNLGKPFLSDIEKACKNENSQTQTEQYVELSKKYKIDFSVIFLMCNDGVAKGNKKGCIMECKK